MCKKMSKTLFRKILLLYALAWLLMGAVGGYYGYELAQSIPNLHERMMEDEEFTNKVISAFDSVSSLRNTSNIINMGALILGVASWAGLFMLWRPARIIYLVSLILSFIIAPIFNAQLIDALNTGVFAEINSQYQTPSFEPWSQIMLAITAFANGALLVVIFTNLGNNLFNKK